MSNHAIPWVLAIVVTGCLLTADADGQERPKHSGTIVAVARDAQTITVEEMGPWTGPTTSPLRRTVKLTSQTRIGLAARSTPAPTSGGWPGDFQESPLEATDLRPGDFVTVTATTAGGEVVAESVAVMRLAGDPTLRASRLPVKR